MKLRYALPTRCLSTNLKQALLSATQLKADGVQIDVRQELPAEEMGATAIRDFRNRLKELNLSLASAAFPMRQALHTPEWIEQRLNAIRTAMTFSYQLGTDVLTLRPGTLPNPDEQSDQWQIFCEILNDLAGFGNHSGVTLCLSLSMEYPQRVKQLFQNVTAGPLGLNFDPLNVLATEQSVSGIFREFHREIQHVRARDGLRNLDDEIEEYPVGMGAVDWMELLALLHEADYQNWIVLDRTAGENRVRDLSVGLTYLRKLLPFS